MNVLSTHPPYLGPETGLLEGIAGSSYPRHLLTEASVKNA